MADYTVSSGNVFKDLGLPAPDERLAKAKLAYKINRFIDDQEMTQKEAADLLGISRSKMTALRNGRLKSFTVDGLFSLIEKLGPHIQRNTQDDTPQFTEMVVQSNQDKTTPCTATGNSIK